MLTKNHVIDRFLLRDKSISNEEHEILFKEQNYWEKKTNYKPFFNALEKVISLQNEEETVFLSCICFPKEIEFNDLNLSPEIKINFAYCKFYKKVNFSGIDFTKDIDFNNTIFYDNADFKKTTFNSEVDFQKSNFYAKVKFNTLFKQKAHFNSCIFQEISFEYSVFEEDAYFDNSHFQNKTSFLDARFKKNANFNKCLFDGITTSFNRCKFNHIVFSNSNFLNVVSFQSISCNDLAYFNNMTFSSKVEFNQSKFNNDVTFENTNFESSYFFNCNFNKIVSFKNTTSSKIISFEEMSCGKLDMKNSNFAIVNFLNIKGKDYFTLKKIHLDNKETARIIKSHLEKQHNIIEANKFFVFEQEKYYDELNWFKNFGNKFVVGLNKLISNHQTSWLKVLFGIVFYTVMVFIGYEYFIDNYQTLKQGILASVNKSIELVDPLSMFKKDNEVFKDKQALGFIIRVLSLYLIWQFLTAFRQNTRRK